MIMKRLLVKTVLIAAAFLCAFPSGAQTSQAEIKQKISKAAASVKSMECDFVQTKKMKMLGGEMTARGKMYFSGGNKLRWEYTSPYKYTFILNDSKVVISKDSRSDVIDVNQNAMFKEIVRIMMNSVTGKSLTDEREFTVTVSETSSTWTAGMTPVKKEMKKLFKRINLSFDRKKSMVTSVELVENGGDTTLIELLNVKTNAAIDAKVFRID